MNIRNFTLQDLEALETIAAPIYYPDLWEPETAYTSRYKEFPADYRALEHNGIVRGYCFSHPTDGWHMLGENYTLPPKASAFYIHDLAVDKNYRKYGFGKELARDAINIGLEHCFTIFRLIAVLKSESFWAKFGFCTKGKIDLTPKVRGVIMELEL